MLPLFQEVPVQSVCTVLIQTDVFALRLTFIDIYQCKI